MIVYAVQRRFFDMKLDAERHRVSLGLPRDATLKVEINDRRELAALLTGLCEPTATKAPKDFPAPAQLLDQAYVAPDKDIPAFIVNGWEKLFGEKR